MKRAARLQDQVAARAARARAWGMRLVASALLGSALAAAGCHRREVGEDDASRLARDRQKLAALVQADARVDRAFKAADDASHEGDDDRAATLLETTALPAADTAIAEAQAATMETAWGEARKGDLRSLLEGRRAELPRYAAAIRGTDLEAKLAAVVAQAALQKRAFDAATAITDGVTKAPLPAPDAG